MWGSHTHKAGFYYQNSFKPQSIFASFNGQINFNDDANNPFDTGYGYANAATGVFNTYTQASKFAIPEWRYKNVEWYVPGQLEGRQQVDARLRRPLLLPDAAVGRDAAGVELHARRVRPRNAAAQLYRRCASAPILARATTAAAWIRRSSAGPRRRRPTPSRIGSSAG